MANVKYKLVQKRKSLFSKIGSLLRGESLFDTGGNGRRNRGWTAGISGPNSALTGGYENMRDRSRDLTRKFPLLNGAYDTLASNIVGTGIRALPKVEDKNYRDLIKKTWETWCEECDADGLDDFAGLLDMAVRQRFEVGEIFVHHKYRSLEEGLIVPYQIQLLESEQIPYDKNISLPDGGYIIGGIEFNAQGRRVAYHVYKNHPGENILIQGNSIETVRIPANEIVHYFKRVRPGQVRGLPEGYAAHNKARDMMIYDEAELIKKQTAAQLMGFVTTPNPDGPFNEDEFDIDAGAGEAVAKLEAATMMTLEPGEDIKFNNPVESGASYEPFKKSVLREIAGNHQMSYEEFSHDLSGVNFSSIRAGLNQSQRKHRKEQRKLIHMICKSVYEQFIEIGVLSGVFNFPDYLDNPRKYKEVQWQPPGWAYVNPQQEIAAKKEEVKAGFKSRSQVIAEMGFDAEEVDELIARDFERSKAKGLNFDTDPVSEKNIEKTNSGTDPDAEKINE